MGLGGTAGDEGGRKDFKKRVATFRMLTSRGRSLDD